VTTPIANGIAQLHNCKCCKRPVAEELLPYKELFANTPNSTTKASNSIAKATNWTAKPTNSTTKVPNSTANGMESTAKVTNSIAKTCTIYHSDCSIRVFRSVVIIFYQLVSGCYL